MAMKSTGDQKILNELRGHLERAKDWANEDDIGAPSYEGWTCVKSTLDAVNDGDLCLALARWDDLSSESKPELSEEGRNWRSSSQRPGWPPGWGRGAPAPSPRNGK